MPLVACLLQAALWEHLRPLALFFFWPAVFVVGWVGDICAVLTATAVSSLLSLYFFMGPGEVFAPKHAFELAMFATIGASMASFSVIRERTKLQRLECEHLKASVRARDDFLAMAAHELKSPLTAMFMQLQTLERMLGKDPATTWAQKPVTKAAGCATRLDRLIGQMLDVSRITTSGLRLEPEAMNLSQLVAETVAELAEARKSEACPIALACEPQVAGCWDKLRMQQVVSNLVGNAIKYGQGKPIEVDLRTENAEAVLRVTDHGVGIDVGHQKKLFQKFEHAVETRDFGGFGLGLWITNQIVAASGGRIEVQSQVGEGSTFTVRLFKGKAASREIRAQ